MGKYIVYQGYAERWRWREVDDAGATVLDAAGEPHSSPIDDANNFVTFEDAVAAVRGFDQEAEIEVREAADFRSPAEQEAARG